VKRAFLDANVLFSAAYREKSGLLRLWRVKDVKLLTCDYAAQEAARNLQTPERQKRLRRLLRRVEVVPSPSTSCVLPVGIELSEKDRPILGAALESKSTHLLTGDTTHFGKYFGKRAGGVKIMTPAHFLTQNAG